MDVEKLAMLTDVYEQIRLKRPLHKKWLKNYIKVFLNVDIPDHSFCAGHSSPMDYLWHAFNCDQVDSLVNGDCIVWANRGGGKTQLAAIATLLDCILKPNCDVRILGGSLEQSSRMYEYMMQFLYMGYDKFLLNSPTKAGCEFVNGSTVQVLAQSDKSVRGAHVHKLRCDEIELFDEDIYQAANFITQSSGELKASMEIISTMHKPYGMMQKVVSEAADISKPVFKWCLWEVIEKCTDRNCSSCLLYSDCKGIAKQADGYYKIDDAISQKKRSSQDSWESEILCKRPTRCNLVFADFAPELHVKEVPYNPMLPLYRSLDFGFVNPFVCLWIQIDDEGSVRIIDEYRKSRVTIDEHARVLLTKTPCTEESVAMTFCDPSGSGVNDITGTSPVNVLRSMGIKIRYQNSRILEGIELIRRKLKTAIGDHSLVIDPKCRHLIEAMHCYHYPDCPGQDNELPVKDGVYDHSIDALRYFLINYEASRNIVRSVMY